MAQMILTEKRLEELLSKDFELRRLMAIMAMLASLRSFALNEIPNTTSMAVPELIRMNAAELSQTINLEESLTSLPTGSEPPGLKPAHAAYRRRLREHREYLRELKHAVEIIAGNKPCSPRSIVAACERLLATIGDIAVERRAEATERLSRVTLRFEALGLREDKIIHLLRLRLDLELNVAQNLESLRALQQQHNETPRGFIDTEALDDAELSTLRDELENAILELQTRPNTQHMEVA